MECWFIPRCCTPALDLGRLTPLSELFPQLSSGRVNAYPRGVERMQWAPGRWPEGPLFPTTYPGQGLDSLSLAGIAKACEQNLQKTLRFGGRLELPSSMELRAMLVSVGWEWGSG